MRKKHKKYRKSKYKQKEEKTAEWPTLLVPAELGT